MARNRLILCLFAIMAVVSVGLAQTHVGVRLVLPPFDEITMEDMWALWLSTTGGPATVYLYGYIEVDADRVVECTTSNALHLDNGQHRVTAQGVHGVRGVKCNQAYRAFVQQGGKLPEDDYTFCVEVYDSATTRQLGRQCRTMRVRHPSPSRLIRPLNGSSLTTPLPEFVYTAPMPKPPGPLTYELRVYEVKMGQTPLEAAAANPPWFIQKGIKTTSLKYPTRARALGQGMTFAWYVTAGMLKSQVFSFTVKGITPPPEPTPPSPTPTPLPPRPGRLVIRPDYPSQARPAKSLNPTFGWTILGRLDKGATLSMVLRELPKEGGPDTGRVVFRQDSVRGKSLRFPKGVPALDSTKPYCWQLTATKNGQVVAQSQLCFFSFWDFFKYWCLLVGVDQSMQPSLNPAYSVCAGSSVQLYALAIVGWGHDGSTYDWTLSRNPPAAGFPQSGSQLDYAILITPNDQPLTTPGVYTYTLTVTRGTCTTNPVAFTVNVYPSLTASINPPEICRGAIARPSVANLPADLPIDHWEYSDDAQATWVTQQPYIAYGNNGNTLPIEPDCSGGANYVTRWYRPIFAGPLATIFTLPPPPWPTNCAYPVVEQKVWCPTQADASIAIGNCIPLPTVTPSSWCRNGNDIVVPLSIGSPQDAQYLTFNWTWSYADPNPPHPPAYASFDDNGIPNPTFTILASSPPGTYTVQVEVLNGPASLNCFPQTRTIVITVQDQLTVSIVGNKTEVCPNDDAIVDVTHNGPPGTTVTWQYAVDVPYGHCGDLGVTWNPSGSGVTGNRQNANNIGDMGPYLPVPTTSICWKATVTQYPTICDPQYAYWQIMLIEPPCKPTISPACPTPPKCPDEKVTLTASTTCGTDPFTWQWYLDGVPVPSYAPSPSPTYDAYAAGNYKVWVFNKTGCDSAESDGCEVVNCDTKVAILPDTCSWKKGSNVFLWAEVGSLPDPPCGAPYTYLWSTGATTSSIHVTVTATKTYTVTVTNSMGCETSASKTIKVCP